MRALKVLRQLAVAGIFQSRQLLRTPFFVQQAIAAPLSFALLRALGSRGVGAEIPTQLWFDAAVAGMWATTTTAVGIIGFQRFQGTLEHLALSTLRPSVVFGSLCAAATVIGWIGIPISLAVQYFLTGSVVITINAVIAFLFTALACLVSAFVLASLFILSRSATAYEPLILAPIWLLTGIVIPLTAMPDWLQGVALFHPLTAAVNASRSTTTSEFLMWLLVSLAVSAVWLVVAARLLRVAMRRARVLGTLGLA